MTPAGHYISEDGQLTLLMKRRRWLDMVQEIVRSKCPPNVAGMVNVRDVDTASMYLLVSVPHSAMATQMRYMLPHLHESLGLEVAGYKSKIKGVRIVVRDSGEEERAKRQVEEIEKRAAMRGRAAFTDVRNAERPQVKRRLPDKVIEEMGREIAGIRDPVIAAKMAAFLSKVAD
jgi:hypothetical protein